MIEKGFEKNSIPSLFDSLLKDCRIAKDRIEHDAYILQFRYPNATTTIRIVLDDRQSGADVAITNMTTLPGTERGGGLGSTAIQTLLAWAKENSKTNIQAVQVQPESETFWEINGFEKKHTITNDFQYTAQD